MAYLIVFVLLSLFILVHELGHFAVARRLGIPVARFSVGFGPSLFSWTAGETEYRISMIPVGGYVLVGMQGENAFLSLPVGKRVLFSLGGPAANVALTVVAFAGLNLLSAGFSPSGILVQPFAQTADAFWKVLATVPTIFSHGSEVSGLVGLVAEGGDFMGGSVVRALQLSIVLNLNLAIINLLPLPPLDGGKIVLYALEKIDAGLARFHLPLSAAGWVLILGALAYVTVQDIKRLMLTVLT